MSEALLELRAQAYQDLAAALADPPYWLASCGCDWPLWEAAERLAPGAPQLSGAVAALKAVAPASLAARRRSYRALFSGAGRPRFWLYESLHRSGRILGPQTAALEQLYAAAGLTVSDGELPDHASVELSFLAFLVHMQAEEPALADRWRRLERRFIELHAGRWLPALGRGLAETEEPVYRAIGLLLVALLAPPRRPSRRRPAPQAAQRPRVDAAICTLCSFCIPACPTRALALAESATETRLVLQPASCVGCALCARACPEQAVTLAAPPAHNPAPLQTLAASPRLACTRCGKPTVSKAEFRFVASRVGSQSWLRLCPACRGATVENPL